MVLHEMQGQLVPRSFTPGYVILSFIVSYVGAWTTLELLHRRTAGRGLYNWYLLVGSSLSMGGVAIWSMHFIGNRATVIGNGAEELQVAYNPGFTALSFFVPVLAFLPIFFAADAKDKIGLVRVGLGGTWAGLTICGMHYLGQLGVSNYDFTYHVPYVVGSAVIAIGAASAALTIFFVLEIAWTNSYWKRSLCAVLLAGGVSGMHWVALIGTDYRFKGSHNLSAASLSRKEMVGTAIGLSLAACAILSTFAILAQRKRQTSAVRAKQIVLACAIFDPDGRLLVSPEGILPRQKITSAYTVGPGDDDFGNSHPVFLWLFRASRNWQAILDLIPCMRHHLYDNPSPTRCPSGANTLSAMVAGRAPGDTGDEFSTIFKERFCVAALDIAEELGEPLGSLGVLYDEVMNTGTIRGAKLSLRRFRNDKAYQADLEAGLSQFDQGRGQLLCLVRQTSKAESARLQSRGFRFLALRNLSDMLAVDLRVQHGEVMRYFERMQDYSRHDQLLEPGVHLACFAMRAKVSGGFDVLVRQHARSQPICKPLSFDRLEEWQIALLKDMDGWPLVKCLKELVEYADGQDRQTFTAKLCDALKEFLQEDLRDNLFLDSVFVAPIQAPCRGINTSGVPDQTTLITLRILLPIHWRISNPELTFSPLNLLRCQQYVYPNSPDHGIFARKVHREFAPIVDSTTHSTVVYRTPSQGPTPPSPCKTTTTSQRKTWWALTSWDKRWSGACESEAGLEKADGGSDSQAWGGILVSEQVNVNVEEVFGAGHIELEETTGPVSIEAVQADLQDSECFVDRLFAMCVKDR